MASLLRPSSLSVVIPALNEERHLADAAHRVAASAARHFETVELVIVDDGSTDRTPEIAESLRRTLPGVAVVRHAKTRGLGAAFASGVARATGEWVTLAPGDGELDGETYDALFAACGRADLVIAYTENDADRPFARRFLSRAFTRLANAVWGLSLRYYNGAVLQRRADLTALPPWSASFAYQVEILGCLIRSGATYVEVPIRYRPVSGRPSKAFRIRNVAGVAATLLRLFWRARLRRGGRPDPCRAGRANRDSA